MIHYWYTVLKIFVLRHFQPKLAFDHTLSRTFRVRLFDCDGLRVMTASKYPAYMDFIRWELMARTPMFGAIVKRGLAPTLGSQKLIYRRPLKLWSKFEVTLMNMGWDEKWVYHAHYFKQRGTIMAIGITRALIWKKDIPHLMSDVIQESGGPTQPKAPPAWVMDLFVNDRDLIDQAQALMDAE